MGKIGADIGLMREAAHRMRSAAEQFDHCGPAMGQAIETLGTVWAGSARENCLARWATIAPLLPQGTTALRSYADMLEQIAAQLEREARKSWFEKALGKIGSVVMAAGGILNFVLPPLGMVASFAGAGLKVASAVPDLIRYGDLRAFAGQLSGSLPLPPGPASTLIRGGLQIATEATSVKDALQRAGGMVPAGTDSVIGTALKVANSKDLTDGMLNATGFLGQNDLVNVAVTTTKVARADNVDEALNALSERLPVGTAEALRQIRAVAAADDPMAALSTVIDKLSPAAAGQVQSLLNGVVPPELAQATQAVLGLNPGDTLQNTKHLLNAVQHGDFGGMLSAGTQLAGGVPLPASLHDSIHVFSAAQHGDLAAVVHSGAQIVGAPPLPDPVRSAAGFLYDTQASHIPDAGRAWSELSRVNLGSIGHNLPAAVSSPIHLNSPAELVTHLLGHPNSLGHKSNAALGQIASAFGQLEGVRR